MALTERTVLATLAAGLLSGLLNLLLIRYQRRLNLMAAPRSDRWHRLPTPNTGGVAILLACAIVYAAAFPGMHRAVALGAGAMALLGFIDDRVQLRPIAKFIAQCAIAAFVIFSGVSFPATLWPAVNMALAFLWIVGITNAFNLIDNMDGLCAGVVIIIAGFRYSLLALDGYVSDAALFAVVGAAYAGFLVFNYRPARIFMGDCGSMFAGFSLATLTLASPVPSTRIFLAGAFYPALTFTYPIFDTLLVTVLRKSAGRRISVGGRDHSSHRLAALGMSEGKVVWLLWLLTALGSSVGMMVRWMPLQLIGGAAVLVGSLTMFGLFLGTLPPYSVPQDTAMLSAPSSLRRYVPSLRAGTIVVVDALVAGLALFIAFLVRYEIDLPAVQVHNLLASLPVVVVWHGLVCCFERSFLAPWRMLGVRDIAVFARAVVLSASLSYFFLWFAGIRSYPRGVMVLYCVLTLALSTLLRRSLRILEDVFYRPDSSLPKVAIFGANADGEIALRLVQKRDLLKVNPVVFLDYDRSRHGMRICGIPVRSCHGNLAGLAAQFGFEAVILPPGARQNGFLQILRQDCHDAGLPLRAVGVTLLDVSYGVSVHASG